MSEFWQAVGLLRLDRPRGLVELERCFTAGSVPVGLSGRLRGRLLAMTVGHGADALFETFGRAWMPWLGKRFDPGGGWNVFTTGGGRAIRARWPSYAGARTEPDGTRGAFRFVTSVGRSALLPVEVLRIDYRDVPENPRPVRDVLDELVRVDADRYLGQALLRSRGGLRRGAWFSLERSR
jgi:hypothetical protein